MQEDKRTIKEKINFKLWNLKQDIKIGVSQSVEWFNENKEFAVTVAIPAAIAVVGGANKIAKSVDRKVDLKKEQMLKDRRVYNRSTGSYLALRRKMTAREQVEYERRKKNGEPIALILNEMGQTTSRI